MSNTKALDDVIAERARQIQVEGWTVEHDDKHRSYELPHAAAAYAIVNVDSAKADRLWPFNSHWFKSGDHRRNCVKAAAMLLAEIERIDRAQGPSE